MRAVFKKSPQFILILAVSIGWIFSGWPQIFGFPPEIGKAYATDTSPAIAGTGTNVDGAGTEPWATTDEITVAGGGDDGVYATQQNGNLAKSEISDVLAATNFGFSIPDGSTILGIKVEVDRREGNTQANGGIIDNTVQLIDESGTIRTTVNKADTATFWPTADGTVVYGATDDLWGEAAGFWTTTKINDPDFGVAFVAENKKVGGGGAVEEALVDFIRVTVTYGPPAITVGTIGTQTATVDIPSTGQYVGGAFTMVRSGGSANVTSITITENGTVDASADVDNIKLQYDLDTVAPYDCASVSYDAGDTQYGSTDTDGFSAADGTAAFTGSVSVSDTQAMCVYAVVDITSGASDAETLEIQITDPSTDVVVSAGDVTPATAVAVSGSTELNLLPNVFIDHFRWRDDNGPEGGGNTQSAGNILPNGDSSVAWNVTGSACSDAHWCALDETTGDLDTGDFISIATNNATDIFNMGTLTGNPPYSEVTVWIHAGTATDDDVGVTINIGGVDETEQVLNVAGDWISATFSGLNMSQEDLDGMLVKLRYAKVGGPAGLNTINAMYAEVSETIPPADWLQDEDIVHTNLDKNTNIRLRFQVDNTGGSADNYNYRLEWAAQSGTCDTAYSGESYAEVPDVASGGEHFDMVTSAESLFVDGDPTTAQLTADALSFIVGDQVESTSNQSGAITLAQNQYTEVEYVFQANSNATDGGVYCFRVTDAGTELDGADVVAQVTLASGGAVYSITITSSGTIEYGFVELSTATTTVGNGYTQTAQNDGDTAEKLNIKSSDATGGTTWTLASAIDSNIFKHEFSTTTGSQWDTMPDNSTYVTAVPSVAVSGTANFDFRLTTPSASTDYQQKSITITVQAVAP